MTTDARHKYRQHPTTRSDFARRSGRSRSTITEACAGPLAPACCREGYIDAAHPATVEWARKRGIDPERLLEETTQLMRQADRAAGERARRPSPAPTYEELASRTGLPLEQIRDDLAAGKFDGAVIPRSHVTVEQFAFFAGSEPDDILEAIDWGDLASAVRSTGLLDLVHRASLQFMARRPFKVRKDGTLKAPDGYLSSAMLGENKVDISHPVAAVFMARCLGRVPTEADLAPA